MTAPADARVTLPARRVSAPATATVAGALTQALRDAMTADPDVVLLGDTAPGEVTDALAADFGEDRCLTIAPSATGALGPALGMAMYGMRPVVEMRPLDGGASDLFQQLAAVVSGHRARARGAAPLPLTVRLPYGGGLGAAEVSSMASFPGLQVVAPATVSDAYGMLREAISSDDPVVFLEPRRLYGVKDTVDLAFPRRTAPFGRAVVRAEGGFATLLTYGPSLPLCLDAARAARAEGWELTVVDLRSLVPFDDATVCAAVRRTGRAVVVHEAAGFAGPGAEIAARVSERCFHHLQAPVLRVVAFGAPYGTDVDRVLDAVARLQ